MKTQKLHKTFIIKLIHKSEDFQFLWDASKEYGEYYNKQIDVLTVHFEKMKQDKELKMISKFDFAKMFAQKRMKYKPKFIRQSHVEGACFNIYNSMMSFFSLKKSGGVENCQPPKKYKSEFRFNSLEFVKSKLQPQNNTLKIIDNKTIILRYNRDIEFKCRYSKKFDITNLNIASEGHKIVWNRKFKCFYFHLCLNINQEFPIEVKKTIYIDLGQKTLVTGYIPESNEILTVSSKSLTNKKLNKRIDLTQSKRDDNKLTKHSRRWKFINKAKRRLENKRTNQKKTYLHKVSRKLVTEHSIIVVGKLSKNRIDQSMKHTVVTSGIPLNSIVITNKKIRSKQANRSRNQDWPIALFVSMLSYKSKFGGKRFEEIDESYTTQECCCCKNRQTMKLSDRTYHCKCGFIADRDVNSSVNIYDKYTGRTTPNRNVNFLNGVKYTYLTV